MSWYRPVTATVVATLLLGCQTSSSPISTTPPPLPVVSSHGEITTRPQSTAAPSPTTTGTQPGSTASATLLQSPVAEQSGTSTGRYRPTVATTWQWQLDGTINTSYDVDLYDVDLFDTSESTIAALHARGAHVVCYFSAGSYEAWRPDAGSVPASARGATLDGWDEQWLDIRRADVRRVIEARIELAAHKGCDGVEPDNVDGYTAHNGLGLTGADQLDYNTFVARTAHDHGLAVGLKNDLDQAAALEPLFDFAVNEQCHEYDECDVLAVFVAHGKPVLNAEYDDAYDDPAALRALCSEARSSGLQTLYLPLDLDGSFRVSCS